MLKAQCQAFSYQAFRTYLIKNNKRGLTVKKRYDLGRI